MRNVFTKAPRCCQIHTISGIKILQLFYQVCASRITRNTHLSVFDFLYLKRIAAAFQLLKKQALLRKGVPEWAMIDFILKHAAFLMFVG